MPHSSHSKGSVPLYRSGIFWVAGLSFHPVFASRILETYQSGVKFTSRHPMLSIARSKKVLKKFCSQPTALERQWQALDAYEYEPAYQNGSTASADPFFYAID